MAAAARTRRRRIADPDCERFGNCDADVILDSPPRWTTPRRRSPVSAGGAPAKLHQSCARYLLRKRTWVQSEKGCELTSLHHAFINWASRIPEEIINDIVGAIACSALEKLGDRLEVIATGE